MLPSEIAVAVITVINLIWTVRVTRKDAESAGFVLPFVIYLLFSLAYSAVLAADTMNPAHGILSDEARRVWELTIRLQGSLSLFVLLLSYSTVLSESRAYRNLRRFFLDELNRPN